MTQAMTSEADSTELNTELNKGRSERSAADARYGGEPTTSRPVWVFEGEAGASSARSLQERDDVLAQESPLAIEIEWYEAAQTRRALVGTTLRTPGDDEALAMGLLFYEGYVDSPADLRGLEPCHDSARELDLVRALLRDAPARAPAPRLSTMTASCGLCGHPELARLAGDTAALPSPPKLAVTACVLTSLSARARAAQPAFGATGGVHGAAWFSPGGELLALSEDIGRHNAVDRLLGRLLLDERALDRRGVLFLSGRAGLELVSKSARFGAPLVLAVGAPSAAAVDLAQRAGLTLIGFAREGRFTVYTHPERVRVDL